MVTRTFTLFGGVTVDVTTDDLDGGLISVSGTNNSGRSYTVIASAQGLPDFTVTLASGQTLSRALPSKLPAVNQAQIRIV